MILWEKIVPTCIKLIYVVRTDLNGGSGIKGSKNEVETPRQLSPSLTKDSRQGFENFADDP